MVGDPFDRREDRLLESRPPVPATIAFIDEHRDTYAGEPIRKLLPIAPSTYRVRAARQAAPEKRPARARTDAILQPEIRRVWEENFRLLWSAQGLAPTPP